MTAGDGVQRASTFAMLDLAGYTALTEQHGDLHAADLAIEFAELARRCLRDGDRLIKSIGDAVLLASSDPQSGIDMYVGQGGAPEGVLAAAALRCIGGQFQGRLVFRNEDEKGRARRIGITDFSRKYKLHDLAKGDVIFAATGVTDGTMLRGVRRFQQGATTHSIVMRSATGTVRIIEARHSFDRKPWFDKVGI